MHACHKSKKAACFGKVSLILGLIELITVVVIVVVLITAVSATVSSLSAASLYSAGSSSAKCALEFTQSKCNAASGCKWNGIMAGAGMCTSK